MKKTGTLTINSDSAKGPKLIVDGVVSQTIRNALIVDRKPEEINSAFAQATDFMQKILRTYDNEVAEGEVGEGGSAVVASKRKTAKKATALLYGRVQSGKTQAMILSAALAVDNGFKVIVILTSDSVELVEQTSERFGILGTAGVMTYDSSAKDTWNDDADHIRRTLNTATGALVVICQKNRTVLDRLNALLMQVKANEKPALIFDDEADQATLDTMNRKRSQEIQKGGDGSAIPASAINSNVDDLREVLDHHVFTQVTATPYSMLLLNKDDALRPSFTHLLEPGTGYFGGEAFFSTESVELGRRPIEFVDDNELTELRSNDLDQIPIGLKRAVTYFVVTSAWLQSAAGADANTAYNMLCHPHHTKGVHQITHQKISKFLERVQEFISTGAYEKEVKPYLLWSISQLKEAVEAEVELDFLKPTISRMLGVRRILLINSEGTGYKPRPGLNFVVGGNIIGRGLTINNLLVTYYIRPAAIGQMDTVYQHARMFGYRSKIGKLMRVFLPSRLAVRFHSIHESETNLRRHLAKNDSDTPAIQIAAGLRATRPNVLDATNILSYFAGDHIFPKHSPEYEEKDTRAGKIWKEILAIAGQPLPNNQFVKISLAQLKQIISEIDVYQDEIDSGQWDPEILVKVLDSLPTGTPDVAYVRQRSMARTSSRLLTGAASGKEVDEAHQMNAPVLMIFQDPGTGSQARGYPYIYPSLILPLNLPTLVLNIT